MDFGGFTYTSSEIHGGRKRGKQQDKGPEYVWMEQHRRIEHSKRNKQRRLQNTFSNKHKHKGFVENAGIRSVLSCYLHLKTQDIPPLLMLLWCWRDRKRKQFFRMFTLYSCCKLHGIEIVIQPATLSPIMWSHTSTPKPSPTGKTGWYSSWWKRKSLTSPIEIRRKTPFFTFYLHFLADLNLLSPFRYLLHEFFPLFQCILQPFKDERGEKSLSLLVSTEEAVLKHFWKLHARQQKHFTTHPAPKRKQKRKSTSSMKKHPLLDEGEKSNRNKEMRIQARTD